MDLPPLPPSAHPNYITPAGHARLLAQLASAEQRLAEVTADRVESQLQRTQLALEIRRLQARLESAIPVSAALQPAGQVGFGSVVEWRDPEGQIQRYEIVGEDEIDAVRGRVSWRSPLARALMGARVGDIVLWERPAGEVEIEVRAIR